MGRGRNRAALVWNLVWSGAPTLAAVGLQLAAPEAVAAAGRGSSRREEEES